MAEQKNTISEKKNALARQEITEETVNLKSDQQKSFHLKEHRGKKHGQAQITYGII